MEFDIASIIKYNGEIIDPIVEAGQQLLETPKKLYSKSILRKAARHLGRRRHITIMWYSGHVSTSLKWQTSRKLTPMDYADESRFRS